MTRLLCCRLAVLSRHSTITAPILSPNTMKVTTRCTTTQLDMRYSWVHSHSTRSRLQLVTLALNSTTVTAGYTRTQLDQGYSWLH